MKKWLIGLSVGFNLATLVTVAGLILGGGKLFTSHVLKPSQDRRVSQFDVLPVQPGNINRIIDTISAASPGTQIYVQSILPRAASYREEIEELNGLLEDSISGRANWIDLYPLYLDSSDGSIRDDLSNDELHLLGQGYLLWRDAIAGQVSQ